MTLRRRIAAVAGLAVALTVLAAAVVIYFAVRADLRGEVDHALRARAREVMGPQSGGEAHASPCADPDHALAGGHPDGDERRFSSGEGYVQVACADGAVLRPPGASARLPVTAAARAIVRSGHGREVADLTVGRTRLRVLTEGLGDGAGAVQVARPLTDVDHELDRILTVLVILGGVGIALGAGLGALVARTALAPIGRFTRRTEALSARPDPSERMEVRGRDELSRLARSFNATLDALERSVEAQRHLVADASHELRTPIASLRANVQTLEEEDRLPASERAALHADILAELDELTALVGDVLELARGTRPTLEAGDVRLDRIVAELAERESARAGSSASFALDLEATVVHGDGERIARAVANLLGNARKWSPPGGEIEVTLRGGTLTVRDHGPGFDPADLPRVFERFYRSDRARGMPGSGLGLAIVRQAAEGHGGWVRATNAPDGGAVLRVRFAP